MTDHLVAALRAAGCVYAEEEATEIRRLTHDSRAVAGVVAARRHGLPLEQALGQARYLGLDVAVQDGVFVPRRRTEVLVRRACAQPTGVRVAVDLGCGSGVIAAALARKLPHAQVHACDLDATAVACARRNAETFGFVVHQGDWWDALPDSLRDRVDLAVAYLPHVPTQQLSLVPRDFRSHEPRSALCGGADGLMPFRAVVDRMEKWLSTDGALWTLLAEEQVEAARDAAGDRDVRVEIDDGDAVLRVAPASCR